MSRRMYTERCALNRRVEVGRDKYNNPTYTDESTEAPCWYTHRSSVEDPSKVEQTATAYLIQLPPEYHDVVQSCDTITLPIGRFTVVGDTMYQPNGFAVEGYTQATLERVRG